MQLQSAATINQLILKQYWNEEKSAKDENPLTEDEKVHRLLRKFGINDPLFQF